MTPQAWAIALEQPARRGERQPAAHVCKIHGDLPRQRNLRASARRATQIRVGNTEDLNDSLLDGLARDIRRCAPEAMMRGIGRLTRRPLQHLFTLE